MTRTIGKQSDAALMGRIELRLERSRRLAHRKTYQATRGRQLAVALAEAA